MVGPRRVGQASGSTSKICGNTAAHRRLASVGARRRAVGLVGAIGHDRGGPVVRESLQGDGIPGAVPLAALRAPWRSGSHRSTPTSAVDFGA